MMDKNIWQLQPYIRGHTRLGIPLKSFLLLQICHYYVLLICTYIFVFTVPLTVFAPGSHALLKQI